jgi:hypothetical protein
MINKKSRAAKKRSHRYQMHKPHEKNLSVRMPHLCITTPISYPYININPHLKSTTTRSKSPT